MLKPASLFQGWDELLEQAHLPRIGFHELRVAHWRELIAQVHAAEGEPDDLRSRFLDLEKNPYPFEP